MSYFSVFSYLYIYSNFVYRFSPEQHALRELLSLLLLYRELGPQGSVYCHEAAGDKDGNRSCSPPQAYVCESPTNTKQSLLNVEDGDKSEINK